MYLKSIELYGFKSFAKKMIFEFNTGITGIVGPNGSGKSNIADAVRWVLGEQRAKQLRGAKMEDVIFAGTDARKPLGYCQVDLTIDNKDMKMQIDYSEVTISRRVYRSGESEYYINGTPCRLMDINELFMDTGVGKEGYSIIGQGQIDKILSTKPDDRRNLFDEAAGIVKFKKRRLNAEKKLNEEKDNLIRINDIIRELESQKETLEGQAITAKKYLSYKEQLKKYDINIFLNDYEELNENIKTINIKENQLQEEIETTREQYINVKESQSKLSEEIDKNIKKTELEKDRTSEILLEKEKQESNIGVTKEQIKNLKVNNERLEDELNRLKEQKDSNFEEKAKYDILSEQLQNKLLDYKNILNIKQEEYNSYVSKIGEDENNIENIKTDIIERLNDIANVKSKIHRYNALLENNKGRNNSITSRKTIIENTNKSIEKELDNIVCNINNLDEKKNSLTNEKHDLKNKVVVIEKDIKEKQYKLNEASKQLHIINSKHSALKDINEQYEGYNYSIKKIMELKKSSKDEQGVLGVIADIIKVEKQYETAIEISLGGNIQNIVTDNENTAKKMINYLKSNKYGRATFLPLSSIRSKENYNKLTPKEDGFIGYANELLSCEDKYKHIIKYLLGRIVVVDNIDNAIKLSKKYKYSLKIVTLTGEVINPGGALTGGAYKNKGNQFLSRKRDLETFEQEMLKVSGYIKTLEPLIKDSTDKLNECNKKIEIITLQEQELNIELNSSSINLNQLKNEINKNKEEIQDIIIELEQLNNQEKELKESLNKLNYNLDNTEVENEDAENLVKTLNSTISEGKIKSAELSDQITKIKIDSSSLEQQFSNVKENILRLKQNILSANKKIENNNIEIEKNKEDIIAKEDNINNYQTSINNFDVHIKTIHEEVEQLTSNKQALVLKQQQLTKKKEHYSERINLLEKDILRLQNSKVKYEVQNEAQMEYIWDEYELTYKMACDYKDDSLGTIPSMKKEHSSLKDDIKKLGDVNVNAIDDFKMVSDRYTFLTEQKEDLVLAEDKLKNVISELNQQMISQFKEKFNEINSKFEEVFKELFGGGKAMLELTDDEDVLECGIRIIASPPGKKLQSMMLLSGGERAFTAIALLFAIQSLKPSPFCVLDEIEAALDDANVERFAKYLKKLAINTQFIIITHRKGTMESADALYGITMQEKGVSTQVSVKLIENELDDKPIL
jgi:chromosome segregation protein